MELLKEFGVVPSGAAHDALDDSDNLRKLVLAFAEKLRVGKSETDVLQMLQKKY